MYCGIGDVSDSRYAVVIRTVASTRATLTS